MTIILYVLLTNALCIPVSKNPFVITTTFDCKRSVSEYSIFEVYVEVLFLYLLKKHIRYMILAKVFEYHYS